METGKSGTIWRGLGHHCPSGGSEEDGTSSSGRSYVETDEKAVPFGTLLADFGYDMADLRKIIRIILVEIDKSL